MSVEPLGASAPYLIEALRSITDEYQDRLESELSPSDELAILTAITKAAIEGFRQGTASVVFEMERRGIKADISVDGLGGVDLWAERYGDEAEER
jgi:hypothetical protein